MFIADIIRYRRPRRYRRVDVHAHSGPPFSPDIEPQEVAAVSVPRYGHPPEPRNSIVVFLLFLWGLMTVVTLVPTLHAEDPLTLDERHLTVNGVKRTFYFHAGQSRKDGQLPLVMVFHGGQGNGLKAADQTGFTLAADRWGFAVAYPNSLEYWNDGRPTTGTAEDDVAFVRTLIDRLGKTENIDRRRIYATGVSNGGMFTLRLACEMSSEIAAFASVVASFPAAYRPNCRPQRPVPILMINGTTDKFMPWEGGSIKKGLFRGAGGEVISVPETVEFWRRHNGCSSEPQVFNLPDRDKNDGTTVQRVTYAKCRGSGALELVRITGGGHTWPGTDATRSKFAARMVGNTSQDIDATEIIWQSFRDRILP